MSWRDAGDEFWRGFFFILALLVVGGYAAWVQWFA